MRLCRRGGCRRSFLPPVAQASSIVRDGSPGRRSVAMTSENEQPPHASRVPDETAHRILARAIELDASQAIETSLEDLRGIAQEAGISPGAFEQALAEFRA